MRDVERANIHNKQVALLEKLIQKYVDITPQFDKHRRSYYLQVNLDDRILFEWFTHPETKKQMIDCLSDRIAYEARNLLRTIDFTLVREKELAKN